MARSGAFLSYARADGKVFAASLRERLEREVPDVRVWQDRAEIEGGVGWWRQIEEALESVEFLVAVMTPGVLDSAVTRKEWRAARHNGVCVFPVKGPGFRFDDARLPGWMRRGHVYDLDEQWPTFVAHLRRGCRMTRVPSMAPPLPASFVERPREFEALKALLLDARTGETISITTSLSGAGGFGKTTLAAALCVDEDIVEAFDDGVLWATLGQTPNVQGELTRLYGALSGDRPGFVSIEDAAQALAEKLEHKRCLIVVDDVWEVSHLRPFLRGGVTCARLVTTRQEQVASEGERIAVDEMTNDEAVSLLTSRLGSRPADFGPFRTLARRLGEWPLLLRLVGSALRQRLDRGDSLEGALRYVHLALEKRGITAFDREGAVTSTLDLSLDLLGAANRLRCEELGVFPEDVAIPSLVIGELWRLDDFDAEEVLSRLHDASLVEFDLASATVRIHDVIRSFFAERLGSGIGATHGRLLDAWPDARRLPHAYAWRWRGEHLVAAGRGAELEALLLDFDWLRRKLDATDIYALLADFALLTDSARLQPLHNVLRLSSHVLVRDKSQLPTQLLGRLADPERDLGVRLLDHFPVDGTRWIRPIVPSLMGPGGALVRTLESPATPHSIAVTPDGHSIISGASDGSFSVWDLDSGTLIRVLHTHGDESGVVAGIEGTGTNFAMMPDGRVLFASRRGLSVWDPAGPDAPRVIAPSRESIASLAVSRDGRRALVGSRKGTLMLVDLATGEYLFTLVAQRMDLDTGETILQQVAHRLGIAAVAIGFDGRTGITGSYDKTLRIWDLVGGSLIDTLYPPHDGIVYALATAANDASLVVSGSGDRTLRIWDLATQSCRATLVGHTHRVYDVALSTDGRLALSGSHDRTIRLWDVASATTLATLQGHSDAVLAVAFVPGERSVVSAAKDGTIRVWKLEADDARALTQEHEGWVHAVAITPDGRQVVTGGQDHRLCVWDSATASRQHVLHAHREAVSAVALHAPSGVLVSGSYDRRILVWDLASQRLLRTLEGHADGVCGLSIAPDGRRLLSASFDGDVIVWDLAIGRILKRWDAHRRGTTFVATFADWRIALTGSMDGAIKVWDIESGACLQTVRAHLDGVTAGAASPTGDCFLSGGSDGALRLWSFPSCALVRTIAGHGSRVRSLCVSADGRFAFSTSYDRYLKVWALPTLASTTAFAADSAIAAVAVSASGELVVAGDAQGSTHFLRFDGPSSTSPAASQ